MELNKSGPRVVSTDRLDQPTVNAIENPPASGKTEPPSQTAANGSAAAPPTPPAAALTAPPAATAAPLTPPTPSPAATAPVAAPTQAAADTETVAPDPTRPKAAKSKQVKKPKQQPKLDDRALARADDGRALASVDDDDGTPVSRESTEDRRGPQDRSRRSAGRWTEREYEVPTSDGRGQRRVIVIRRNDGGERSYSDGLFERRENGGQFGGLFGFR
jgi:hypothetical protein